MIIQAWAEETEKNGNVTKQITQKRNDMQTWPTILKPKFHLTTSWIFWRIREISLRQDNEYSSRKELFGDEPVSKSYKPKLPKFAGQRIELLII